MEPGKKVCNELKAVRKQIADANGIEYTPNVCNHKGDCPGTCPACEEEMRYLERELNLRRMLGKAVVVAGLGIAVATTCSSCIQTQGNIGPVERDSIIEPPEIAGYINLPDSLCTYPNTDTICNNE